LDVTIADTVAGSYLAATSITADAVAEAAAECKTSKYAALVRHHLFAPIAIETLGPMCAEGQSFIRDISERVCAATSDPREAAFLFQRNSMEVQWCNAICFAGTF
jgi:hypothetical protein